jgi:predicted TIM-barrel fold metal-dependent hydrolase
VGEGAGRSRSAERDRLPALIDTDVHPVVEDMAGLRRHMSARCVRRAFGLGMNVISRDPNRIPHPSSGSRLDARTPSGGPPGADPQFAIDQWMDPFGISAAVLIPVQAGTVLPWGDEETGAQFLSAFNRYFMEEWVGLDSRFRLAISVSPYDVSSAVAEVTQYANVPGVCGVFIPHGGVALGRSQYFPLYEAAERHGLPIVMHVTGAEGNFADAPQLGGGLPRTYPERHSLLLNPGQSTLASMIFAGVFDRFPGLKLVLTEYGVSWVPPFCERMDRAWELGERALSGIAEAPSEYVRRNVRFTTQPLDEPDNIRDLWSTMDMMPTDEILMFSSDYPHWDQDDPNVILRSRLPSWLRHQVAYGVALDCFGDRLGVTV